MPRAGLILVVEDDSANRDYARAVLEGEGFEVEAVESAEQALVLLRRRTPNLILMDIQLPGMDGLELTRLLKADPATEPIPIVAMTGQTMPIHQRAAMAAGCAGFIGKPATPSALTSEVMAHFAGDGQ
jgi:two-component system cell cycle response regulator DivK